MPRVRHLNLRLRDAPLVSSSLEDLIVIIPEGPAPDYDLAQVAQQFVPAVMRLPGARSLFHLFQPRVSW